MVFQVLSCRSVFSQGLEVTGIGERNVAEFVLRVEFEDQTAESNYVGWLFQEFGSLRCTPQSRQALRIFPQCVCVCLGCKRSLPGLQ